MKPTNLKQKGKMKEYLVGKPLTVGYDSDTRNPNTHRHKTLAAGSRVRLDCVAPNGNVWLLDQDGERGKIEAGSLENLMADKRLVPISADSQPPADA